MEEVPALASDELNGQLERSCPTTLRLRHPHVPWNRRSSRRSGVGASLFFLAAPHIRTPPRLHGYYYCYSHTSSPVCASPANRSDKPQSWPRAPPLTHRRRSCPGPQPHFTSLPHLEPSEPARQPSFRPLRFHPPNLRTSSPPTCATYLPTLPRHLLFAQHTFFLD